MQRVSLRFHLITLFEAACEPYLSASILGRAREKKIVSVAYQNPREFVDNKWGKVDERPYGGGPGMVMQALPVVKAAEKVLQGTRKVSARSKAQKGTKGPVIIWFSPSGKQFTNAEADKLSKYSDIVLVCGRYEGIDERAKKMLKALAPIKEYAVGEATYTGAEVPAMAIVDAITRRLPGALGKDASVEERRVASSEVYTRPEIISYKKKNYRVPKILTTGRHADIDAWREKR